MSVYSIKNILVPVDVSEASLNGLDTAVSIAITHNSSLTILYVDEQYPGMSDDEDAAIFNNTLDVADVLTALAGTIEHKTALPAAVVQKQGNISDLIIKTAYLQQADLIVMGTHGASGFRDGFMGSNAYRVMKTANCPVLTVPNTRKFEKFNNILFPIRPVSGALSEYNVVSRLTNTHSVLNVFGLANRAAVEPETKVLEKIVGEIRNQLTSDKVKTRLSWSTGESIPDDVIRFSQQIYPDLVVMTSLVDATTKPKFIGPYTQKIINAVKAPVLCVKKLGVPMFA